MSGARSGLWFQYARIINELQPKFVIIENVSALLSRGLETVLQNLDEIGYDAEWHCIPATYVGGSHQRDRVWIIAHAKSLRVEGLWSERIEESHALVDPLLPLRDRDGQWQVEPDLRRSAYGVSTRLDGRVNSWMDRIKQCGNSIVPQIAEILGHSILKVVKSNDKV